MGANIGKILRILEHAGHRAGAEFRVLDIGCQHINPVNVSDVAEYFRRWAPSKDPARVRAYAQLLHEGSQDDAAIGNINGAWLGDLLERVGIRYVAYDIFKGFQTRLLDLNEQELPAGDVAAFDLVLNFGTTEHILNQWNCFKVIHRAAKPGGLIFHSLPFSGFLDHGYFNYQPRFIVELARANGYEIIELSVSASSGAESVVERIVEPYRTAGLPIAAGQGAADLTVPTGGIAVLLRKGAEAPFRIPLETSTTAGSVAHGGDDGDFAAVEAEQRSLLGRLEDPTLGFEEIMDFYRRFVAIPREEEFPLELEKKSLDLALERWPEREDLRRRLNQVHDLIDQRFPLLALRGDVGTEPPPLFDGIEEPIRQSRGERERAAAITAAFGAYFDKGRVRDFPADLEYEAISRVVRDQGATPFLKLRTGKLLSRLTVAFPL